jgi:hypothetical protein
MPIIERGEFDLFIGRLLAATKEHCLRLEHHQSLALPARNGASSMPAGIHERIPSSMRTLVTT